MKNSINAIWPFNLKRRDNIPEKEKLIETIRSNEGRLRELLEEDKVTCEDETRSFIKGLLRNRKSITLSFYRKGKGRLSLIIRKNILGRVFIEEKRLHTPMTSFGHKVSLKDASVWDLVSAIVILSEEALPERIALG